MDLFDLADATNNHSPSLQRPVSGPLAARMRPRSLNELVGHKKNLAPGTPLSRLLSQQGAHPSSVFLWGPPGSGKTTLAYLIAEAGGRSFEEISAVSAGVKEVRSVINAARQRLATRGQETILFIDEVHRFSKTQQDALLPAVENGWVILVAATTENPAFCVVAPLLSRSLVVTLEPLSTEDVRTVLHRALHDDRGLKGKYSLDTEAEENILRLAGADARRCLTLLEAAADGALMRGENTISADDVAQAATSATIRYDKDGEDHYNTISAFIKSLRGSNVDAAMHYLARMLHAGEDPRFIARRLMISAAEDVGMADPTALQTATAAAQAVAMIGMPEARIILAEAVVHIATAPKSNRAYMAINVALEDVKAGKIPPIPLALRNESFRGARELGYGKGYRYAHDDPSGVATMEFMPEGMENTRYYEPTNHGYEANITPRLIRIRSQLRGEN